MERAILLLSGGIDSAAVLWKMKEDYEVHALTIKYGKVNRMEVRSSRALARLAGVAEHIVFEMEDMIELDECDRGRSHRLGITRSYIPARNAVIFGIAAHFAELRGASVIFTGQNRDDAFPDSNQGFIDAYNLVIKMGRPSSLNLVTRLIAPLISMGKREVVEMARCLGVPLDKTWSCHRDSDTPCGVCDGCEAVARSLKGGG